MWCIAVYGPCEHDDCACAYQVPQHFALLHDSVLHVDLLRLRWQTKAYNIRSRFGPARRPSPPVRTHDLISHIQIRY